jgi:hypothetical protein
MDPLRPLLPAGSGVSINSNGGAFSNGKTYDIVQKFRIASKYQDLVSECGTAVTSRMLGTAAQVSHVYAQKVINEVNSEAGLIDPDTVEHDRARGPGARSLDFLDEVVLLDLRDSNPTRTHASYQNELFRATAPVIASS